MLLLTLIGLIYVGHSQNVNVGSHFQILQLDTAASYDDDSVQTDFVAHDPTQHPIDYQPTNPSPTT